jgi:hypothetical protein
MLFAPTASSAAPPDAHTEFFETEVRPLLIRHCAKCHGDTRPKGRLKVGSRADLLRGGDNGAAVVPGKPDESLLIKVVRYYDDLRMPPTGKLTNKQIETFEKWVKLGAWRRPTAASRSPRSSAGSGHSSR